MTVDMDKLGQLITSKDCPKFVMFEPSMKICGETHAEIRKVKYY